jgi:hypothetical protein
MMTRPKHLMIMLGYAAAPFIVATGVCYGLSWYLHSHNLFLLGSVLFGIAAAILYLPFVAIAVLDTFVKFRKRLGKKG